MTFEWIHCSLEYSGLEPITAVRTADFPEATMSGGSPHGEDAQEERGTQSGLATSASCCFGSGHHLTQLSKTVEHTPLG